MMRLSSPHERYYVIDTSEFKMPYLIYGRIDYEKSVQQYLEYNWKSRGNFTRTMTSKMLLLDLDY